MSKKRTLAELEREVARLEKQVTELQEVSTAQLEKNSVLFAQVCDRTETLMLLTQACHQVGLEGEALYVYGSKNAVERVRSLTEQLGLRMMKHVRREVREVDQCGYEQHRKEEERHATSARHR